VQRHFLNCKFDLAADTGRLLADLHQSRKDADYDFSKAYADGQKNATFCVMRADEIRRRLQQCDALPAVDQIRAEMLEYRRRTNIA
jgi:hypothetical protein